MSETFASTLLSASFVFYALGEKSLFPSPFFDFVFLDERTQGRVGPSRSHSRCTCSCLHTPCPPYFCPYKILVILHQRFFHQLPPDSSRDGHLSIQRKKKAGHSVFLWTEGLLLFPDLWPELFLKVSPASSWIWDAECRLLLRFCSTSFHMTQ